MGYFDVQSPGLNNGSITVTGTWYEGGEAKELEKTHFSMGSVI